MAEIEGVANSTAAVLDALKEAVSGISLSRAPSGKRPSNGEVESGSKLVQLGNGELFCGVDAGVLTPKY